MAGAAAFCQPAGEVAGGLGGQRRASLFPAFAGALDVRVGAQVDVIDGERGELGYPQSGLGGEQDEGVVTAAVPGAAVRGGEQCFEFFAGQEVHWCLHGAFGRDGQHAGNQRGMLGRTRRGAAEQRVDRGETGVAGGCCPGWFPGAAGSPLIVSRRAA